MLGTHVKAVVQHMDKECQEALLNGKNGLRITCVGAVWKSWNFLRDVLDQSLSCLAANRTKMRSSTFLLLVGVIFTVYYCDASQKEAEISEELDLSGSGETQDKEALQEGKPDSSQGTETELKELNDKKKKNSNPTSAKSAQGSKRALPALAATVLKNPKIQEAVVDKGLEVMNKLVDKQLQIIDEAQEKASNFLAKEIKLDITPDKGWSTPDMFVPPGYHIDASLSGVEKPEKDQGDVPYTYAPNTGVGYVMMNGCWGTNYTANDPCYNSKTTSTICTDMIDGAAFLGVGFDGRGEYSPESRKMSIVQRNCQNKATYDDLDVPDTMNVHGIYDTSATMRTFESRSEFQTYLQQEAGVSGSYFGFYAGAKKAWGSSSSGAGQQFMSVLDIDVDRYEIFMDEVKPKDLSLAFLREFLSLPRSYFDAGAPIKFQNFIQRWGTHFIKSAKFGGELEIRKTMTAQEAGSKSEFSEKMEFEFKTLFASVGAKYEKKGGTSTRQQSKTTSTEIDAKGGSQDIASILSDVYSPTFKTEFKEWLQSIPKYPKAFKFLMGSIADLVNFRANDLFPDEKVNWGCEGRAAEMETDKDGRKFYYTYLVKGTKTKTYCEYDSRQSLEAAIKDKRTSLKRAIEIYLEEGPVSLSDAHLEKCPPDAVTTPTTKPTTAAGQSGDQWLDQEVAPKWEELIRGGSTFQVTFDMMEDLMNPLHSTFSIAKNMKRKVRYRKGKWYTSDNGNTFHMYNGFSGATGDPHKHKMTILGLTLSYNEKEGSLFLDEQDYTSSKKVFPALSADLKGMSLARVESVSRAARASKRFGASSAGVPCHAEWSNILRMDLKDKEGKCLHFTAASSGTIYVVFSASPKNPNARYVVEMSPQKVAIFKGTAPTQSSPSTAAIDAVALGESVLYESYFVCITISGTNTLIEYGKNQGTKDAGDVYLNMIDNSRDFDIRFYAFGNKDVPVNIMDAHMVSHNRTDVDCKGETMKDSIENLCTAKNCHDNCNPVAGCTAQNDAKHCHDCRVAKMLNPARCVEECPADYIMNKNKECVANYELKADIYGYYRKNPIPVGQELSFCTWAKFGEAPQSDKDPQVNLMQITAGHSMGVRASLGTEGTDVFFEFYYKATAGDLSQKIKVNILTDQKWHQVCILWSSTTTAWSMYLDGNREAFGTYENFLQQRIEGKLGVAMPSFWSKLLITQLNIWDRVLTSQEIAAFAGTCNQGIGNVLSWSDLYDDTKSSEYNKPSTCHVNALALTAHTTAEPVTTAQPVTTTAAPPGKREVRKRGRLYRQKL